jgi:hypothetical protein
MHRNDSLTIAIGIALLGVGLPAHAYFDPNTGGFLYQILFPVLVAFAATWRWIKQALIAVFWRIVSIVKRESRHGDR